MIDTDNIPYDDQKTWDLICSGKTLGVFQCESHMIQQFLKKIKPRNIWELSIVIAGVRPGSLKSGAMDNYLNIKNETEAKVSYNNPVVDNILDDTNGQIIFQEQIMLMGANLAWCDLSDDERGLNVDVLRKAIGKKNQQKILEIGKKFVEGCLKNKIEEEVANNLFEMIKNSGRYAFNLSHSIMYTHVAYKTAYLKAHYPLAFFATYLSYGEEKQYKFEEIKDLVRDAQSFGIKLLPPNINSKNFNFGVEKDSIRYGLAHIKHFNKKTKEILDNAKTVDNLNEFFSLCFTDKYGKKINSNTAEALIKCGCFSDIKVGRKDLLNIYDLFKECTMSEIKWISTYLETHTLGPTNIPDLFNSFLADTDRRINKKRNETLKNLLSMFKMGTFDHPSWVYNEEKIYMGCPISCSSLDNKDVMGSHNCYEVNNMPSKSNISLAAVIESVRYTKTKKGKNPGQQMAIISISDNTGELSELPLFPESFTKFSDFIKERNTVMLDMYKGNNGWIIQNVSQI